MREIITTVALLFGSMVSMMASIGALPREIDCPAGTFASSGIRTEPWGGLPRGAFLCQPPPIGGDDDVITGRQTARQPAGVFWGWLRCADNETPTVKDNASGVRCKR